MGPNTRVQRHPDGPSLQGQIALAAGGRQGQALVKQVNLMRTAAKVLGIAGGVLALMGATATLVIGGADTVVIGGWITAGAAVLAVLGGTLAGTRPRVAALLLALAAAAAGLVAPGVIPAIADTTVVFLGYLAAEVFVVAGAILAWIGRSDMRMRTPAGT